MKGQELLKTYPKTGVLVNEFFTHQLVNSLKDPTLDDDFKEFAKSSLISEDLIGELINVQPRGLFDFFDEHKIFIVIDYDHPYKQFIFHSNNGSGESRFATRIEADQAAIDESFKILEERL